MSRRPVPVAAALALALTVAFASVPGRTTATYPDVMGCERWCEVAASGLPLPFIVDYPGLSPVGSADLVGAVLGLDRVRWDRAALAYCFWLAVSLAGAWIAARAVSRPGGSGG